MALEFDSGFTPRVCPDDVHTIVTLESSVDLTMFINVAHILTNKIPADADCMDDDTLDVIELYLAAHFAVSGNINQQTMSETAGDTSEKYMFKAGSSLGATTYGQQAMVLDCTGTLDMLNEKVPPKKTFLVFPRED